MASPAVSPSDAWAVGYTATVSGAQPLLEHWNGSNWSLVSAAAVPAGSSYNVLNGAMSLASGSGWAIGRSDRSALVLSTSVG